MFEKLEEEDARGAGGATEVRVGQSVHGVVDGTFDAGYLVTIRVGDAETVFRGIMFGHGLYSPLSTDNDVAPDLKKVSRADEAGIPASEQEAGGAGASDITETPQSASLALPSPPPDPCKGLAQVNASTSASPVPTIPHALAGVQPFSQDRLFFASAPLTSPMYDHVHTTYRSPLFPQRQPPQSVAENPYHAVPDYPVYRPAMPTNLTPNFGCPPNSQSLPTDYAAAPVLNRETRKDDDSSIVASDWRLD
ncbi:hypothetical protein KP509_06G089800 [Ceratopteris richardii]|nr:hypothetical protein KP509_06G089800 [Ceratopteris richardii]